MSIRSIVTPVCRRLVLAACALCFTLLPVVPAWSQDCDLITVAAISEALPQHRPWTITSGGPGKCEFKGERGDPTGTKAPHVHLSLIFQLFASPSEVAAILATSKSMYTAMSPLTPLDVPGSEGAFAHRSVPGTGQAAPPGIAAYAQLGRGLLSGTYIAFDAGVEGNDEPAVLALFRTAAANTVKPGAAEATTQCSDFDDEVLGKLILARPIAIARHGQDSCDAGGAGPIRVRFEARRVRDTDEVEMYLESHAGSCSAEPLPALGPYGRLVHSCRLGNPIVEALFFKNGLIYKFDLLTGTEPSPEQRAHLIELAQRRYAR